MQIFSLAGALFSRSLRSVPLCPCRSSAEGAGLVGAFCQGRYFCPLEVWAVGDVTLFSQDGPGTWPLLKGEVVAVAWWFQHRRLLYCGSWHPEPLRLAQHSWGVRYSLWGDEHKGSRVLKIKLVKLQSNFTSLAYLLMIISSWEAVLRFAGVHLVWVLFKDEHQTGFIPASCMKDALQSVVEPSQSILNKRSIFSFKNASQ